MDYNSDWLKNLLQKLEMLDRAADAVVPPIFRAQPDLVITKDGIRKEYEIRPKYSGRAMEKLTKDDLQDQGFQNVMDEWIQKVRDAQDAIIAAAVEAAKGACGVRVIVGSMGDIVSCTPDFAVPPGEIWQSVSYDWSYPIKMSSE